MSQAPIASQELVEGPEDVEAFNRWAMEARWGDGLPLIPSTPERVKRMVEGAGRAGDDVVAHIPPNWAEATIEKIAANAVIAGCIPAYMPVIVAAIEATSHPAVNMYGSQATTHSCGTMVLVSGPLAVRLGIHASSGLFGQGFPANATIGRAVRLVLQNVGGAYPGDTDRSTHGSPAKFTFCFAENEAESPWPPLRTALGFSEADTTVTVLSAEAPHNINDHVSSEPPGLLLTFAQTIATMGKNNAYVRNSDYVVGVGPEHADILGRNGWTRRDVQEYLFQRARIPYQQWSLGGMAGMLPQPKYLDAADPDLWVPMSDTADDILVLVVGGPGRHSCWIPSVGIGRSNTQVIRTA